MYMIEKMEICYNNTLTPYILTKKTPRHKAEVFTNY